MRTTVQLVKDILDDTELTDPQLTSYINSANVFVTDTLAGKSLSDVIMAEIERWLSAHLITATRERQAKQEAAGGASITYAGEWGLGLLSTTYGQAAVMMDSSLTLSALAKGRSAPSMKAITSFA